MKKYKYNFFFWKKYKRGSALLSTLISIALLGVSSAGLLQYIQNFQSTTKETVERVNVDPLLRATIINNMLSILVEKEVMSNGNKATQSRYGICSLLHKPKLSHGVENLKISFQNRTSFNLLRWKVFFSPLEWEHVSASHCRKIDKDFSEGDFSRCFKYIKKTEQNVIYAIAEIIPRKFPSLQKINLQNSDTYDPKQVVFQLRTAVSVYSFKEDEMSDQGQDPNDPNRRGKSTSYISYQSDIVWADAVGECHIQAKDGNWTVVYLSATGPGSNLEHKVINSLIYGNDNCNKMTLFDINESVVQVGRIDDALISSIIALNARVACTKNKFSCRQKIKTEALESDSYDSFQFSFNLLNESYSFIPIEQFNVTLKKSDGTEVDGTDDERLGGVNVSFYDSSAALIAVQANTNINYSINRGSQLISVSTDLSDTSESSQLSSYCHDICQRYDTGNSNTYVYPAVTIHEQQVDGQGCVFSKDYSSSAGNRVQCIVCHTKACHRYGLGTFGPLDNEVRTISVQNLPLTQKTVYGMSDEPLDGSVPECVIENSYETAGVRELPANVSGSGDNAVSGCTAMAMRVSNSNSFKNLKTNTYDATNCSTQLPVLCFTNGHYLPALRVNTSNLNAPYEVVVASFQEAEDACFNIGREIGQYYDLGITLANTYKVEYSTVNFLRRAINTIRSIPQFGGGNLSSSFNLDAPVDLKFDFVNNASRGLFLAPSSYSLSHFKLTEQIRNIITVALNAYNKVWTAMEWDAEGLVVASPPWALKAKDESLALFHDKREDKGHRLVLLQDTNSYNTASKYFALTYDLRWKGLVPQSEGTSLPFVCKNKTNGRFFITSSSGVLSAGISKCNSEGGLFVPPESSLDWSKLMLDLTPNDDYYPFPDPALTASNVVNNSFLHRKSLNSPKAWVALQKITGTMAADKVGPRANELKLYTGYFPTNSVFLKETKSDIIDAAFDAERFSDPDLKSKYAADPVAVITTSGLIPDPGANALLSGIFGLISTLFNLDAIDVDNAPSTSKLSLSGYKKVCVDKSKRNEYIPVSINDLGSSCSSGAVTMDISPANSVQFKPLSYKFVSYWVKNIGVSDTDYIALTGGKLEQKVSEYNDKIDRLVSCGNSCNSDHNDCKDACPGCESETYEGICTGTRPTYGPDPSDPNKQIETGTESYSHECEQTRENCDDRDACYSTCDNERSSCRGACH